MLQDLTTSRGTLTSPGFPYIYGNSRKCTWRIRVPRDMHVLITFKRQEFHIEGCTSECECDYLELSTENKYDLSSYGKYCGNTSPSPVHLEANSVQVKFYSDSQHSRQGFRAVYTAVAPLQGIPCMHCRKHIITRPHVY